MNDASMHFIEIKGKSVGKRNQEAHYQLEIAHTEQNEKSNNVFIYLFFCYIPPSFCFIHGHIMR